MSSPAYEACASAIERWQAANTRAWSPRETFDRRAQAACETFWAARDVAKRQRFVNSSEKRYLVDMIEFKRQDDLESTYEDADIEIGSDLHACCERLRKLIARKEEAREVFLNFISKRRADLEANIAAGEADNLANEKAKGLTFSAEHEARFQAACKRYHFSHKLC